jgi:hypothetical protein
LKLFLQYERVSVNREITPSVCNCVAKMHSLIRGVV